MELVVFCGPMFYKDVAPLALGKAAVKTPHQSEPLRKVRGRNRSAASFINRQFQSG